jgi:hypothetical protein
LGKGTEISIVLPLIVQKAERKVQRTGNSKKK